MIRGRAKSWLRTRVHLGHTTRHYPAYAPRVVFHRVRHWLIGPLMGCSCSTCFHSKWRRIDYPARDGYADRLRIADLERRVRELDGQHPRRAAA